MPPLAGDRHAGITVDTFCILCAVYPGIDVGWQQFLVVALIGALFFWLAILRFRSVAM